tara:strand:- start:2646 stop:2798 length:153 start_codon:yes stop_codon:yes gene_type:complete
MISSKSRYKIKNLQLTIANYQNQKVGLHSPVFLAEIIRGRNKFSNSNRVK